MGRRRQQKKHTKYAQGETQHTADPLSRCVAAHPSSPVVAFASGPSIRIVDVGSGAMVTSDLGGHAATVRVLAFSPDGALLMSAADDKIVVLWDTATWKAIASWHSHKKVSAGTFTPDCKHIVFADKYGDVLIGDTAVRNEQDKPQVPALLFGHLCSVVASLLASPNHRYIVSTDKERKVRVSILPENPMLGSVEIQSYCLGHTYFVSTCAWGAPQTPGGHPTLVTGSGDGTVRLWDPETGKLLDMIVVSAPDETAAEIGATVDGAAAETTEAAEAADEAAAAGGCGGGEGGDTEMGGAAGGTGDEASAAAAGGAAEGGGDKDDGGDDGDGDGRGGVGDEEDDRVAMGIKCAPVTCVCARSDGAVVVALVEGRDAVVVLAVDGPGGKLTQVAEASLPGVRFPNTATFDSAGRLWVCGGPPLDASKALHVGVATISGSGSETSVSPLTEAVLPGPLLSALECRVEAEEAQLAAGTLVPAYTQQLMIMRKRWFTPDDLDAVKRQRKSFPESERLRALAKEHEEAQRKEQQGAAQG
ncbi:hypothetical protein FOA52_015419 [Chlamydomonas sp. UWO 241]|nr:hypothetical protein FOA52_015419 [Chlamydomonas sp. UWO 241]